MKNKTYDKLKVTLLVALPALGVAYSGLAAIWGLPLSDEVVKTDAVVMLFLGTVLHVSTKSYNQTPDDHLPGL